MHHTVDLGTVNPILDCGLVTVPVLTDRELCVTRGIVQAGIVGRVALYHIVAEARIAQVFEQHLYIGLHVGLHVSTRVVQVTHSAPVLTGIVVGAQRLSVLGSPIECGTTVIIPTDVGRVQFIGHTLINLSGESHPVVSGLAVVNNDVGNGANAFGLKRVDH